MRGVMLFILGLLIGTIAGHYILYATFNKIASYVPQLKDYGLLYTVTDHIIIKNYKDSYYIKVSVKEPTDFNITIPKKDFIDINKTISPTQKVYVSGDKNYISINIQTTKPLLP